MIEARWDLGRLRQRVIAGLSLLAVAPLLNGCQKTPVLPPEKTEPAAPAPAPLPQNIPAVDELAPIGRAELLAAAADAADEVAAGNPLPKANLELADRKFEIRLPFGCDDGVSGNWGHWNVDPATHVLRVTFRPQQWGDDKTFQAMATGMSYDAAEGFWIERPWTRSEQCPAGIPAPSPTAPAADGQPAVLPAQATSHTLALVQFFSPDAPRTLRRGSRPYTYTAKVPDIQGTNVRKFRVKLVGRISGFSDHQPLHCVVTSPAYPPMCAAAVEFTQVILEDADTGDSLAEWIG